MPIKIEKRDGQLVFGRSEGGLATGLGSIYKKGNNQWIGWPGLHLQGDREKQKVSHDLGAENMIPIFLTKEEIRDYYEGFSNGAIWPSFHYFNQYVIYKEDLWKAYKKVNKKFSAEIVKVAEPGDTIWIHDYQLLLLPEIIREQLPDVSIGFFLHIPFPSFESFRLLPWRRDILMGMLGADLIGFHTYDDMRHFLSSTNRLAGYSNSHHEIEVGNRKIVVDSFPMGIDYDKYASVAAAPETLEREVRYRSSLGDQKVILSIDRLDYSKGIPQRLKAFEMLLRQHPELRQKVSFIMIVVPSRDKVGKYKELKEEIDELVGRINGKYNRMSWAPIHYFYRSMPLHALSAFYRIAQVALVTPMRDGMNLVCKEYIASKLNKTGVLILSEMAGASKELSDALLVNPNDINQMVDAMRQAINMDIREQKGRMEVMQNSLRRYNIHHWVKLFMTNLEEIKGNQDALATKTLDHDAFKSIQKEYRRAKTRIIFLDYDGTLTPFNEDPLKAKPDRELNGLLKRLSGDPKNNIVIISGRERGILDDWLSKLNVDIICEHGVWLRKKDEDWRTLTTLKSDWKNEIMQTLELYINRTPGSFVEEKDFSLVWHFRKVETGLGELRSRELVSHLKYLVADSDLHVMEGNMVVEIKSSKVNKGLAARKWLKERKHDLVIAFGDDVTDEDTFKSMPKNAYTVKVGGTTSAANYSVPSYREVRNFLFELCPK